MPLVEGDSNIEKDKNVHGEENKTEEESYKPLGNLLPFASEYRPEQVYTSTEIHL